MKPLFSLFGHEPGLSDLARTIPLAQLREWPTVLTTDPRLLSALSAEVRAHLHTAPIRLRYFSATDPGYPNVPLLPNHSGETPHPREPLDTGIRDKFWQRLVVEGAGHVQQPGFATVTGNRIEANHTPYSVRMTALDCRPARAELLAAAVSGAVIVMERPEVGFTAIVREDGIHLTTHSPHIAARWNTAGRCILSAVDWGAFVESVCREPLPIDLTKTAFSPTADLGDALLSVPGSYILKPRFGSNGFCVARITSTGTQLTVESDCPDTAAYLDEFPLRPEACGRDLVAAVATHRARFIDRAVPSVPERVLDRSILEDEIRQDRGDGSLFEPRVVVQRATTGSGERFVVLGAICKRVDTAIGASVARDFREEPLDMSLCRFLRERVPGADLADRVARTRAEILAIGEHLRDVFGPLIAARGARIHQFGIDCRLCWNAAAGRVEWPFLEVQFGIGRITPPALTTALAGYKTRDELVRLFGPEVG